jgi:hypothetical protein
MHEDSYRDGSTDGVEFRVEYAPADPSAARVILFRKVLRPRTNPSDRELQIFKVDLPSAAKAGGGLAFAQGRLVGLNGIGQGGPTSDC